MAPPDAETDRLRDLLTEEQRRNNEAAMLNRIIEHVLSGRRPPVALIRVGLEILTRLRDGPFGQEGG